MNLRISDNQLRFRITREELAELLQKNAIAMDIPLAAVTHCRVCASDTGIPLILCEEQNNLALTIDRKTLENLAAALPSREGIVHGNLTLEVDVRKRMP